MTIDPILFLKLAGYLQIALCLGSLVIPKMLNWNRELNKVALIIKQIFWTYAAYILIFNLSFGLLSVFGAEELLANSFLSKSVSVFIFIYWLARVFIQFFYFDTKSAPQGFIYKLGEFGLTSLFIFLTLVYGWVAYLNFQ